MDAQLGPAHRAAERAAREAYGRLVAYLSARSRDVAAAEDALSDALLAALETWPRAGVPDRPEAWLLAAARRRMADGARRARVRAGAAVELRAAVEAAEREGADAEPFPDRRLGLLFACAHPAIAAAVRTPLMLQAVLGLDAARVASAFLVAPAAMAQRLVRAKAKIRAAGIPFELPEPRAFPARLGHVLEAVYAAYGSGWEDASAAEGTAATDARGRGLADEAVWLGRLLADLAPDEPEALGLLALMLHCEARREARRDEAGRFVPLAEQDAARWSRPLIEEAERALARASAAKRPGRFQLEAAIQSAHAQRAATGRTDWATVALLYEGLVRMAPTVGALVGRSAALAEAEGVEAGLAALEGVPANALGSYQPYWALRAHLLARSGRRAEASAAYARAVGLSEDPAVRAFLLRRAAQGERGSTEAL